MSFSFGTVSFGMVSTYPPTQCGLATFSAALLQALTSSTSDAVGVVSIVDGPAEQNRPEVEHHWVRSDPAGVAGAAAALNRHDIAIVQHEYGIFPGRDGDSVLELVRALEVPAVVVMHTVLTEPSPHQRYILEELAAAAQTVVVMTQTARSRLISGYRVDPADIVVIPHGADNSRVDATDRFTAHTSHFEQTRPNVLTWGLLGEGKGIEWAVEAMALLTDLDPAPRYRVLGQTHPKVVEQHGERYRDGLIARANELGVGSMVDFDNRYLDTAELHRAVAAADVVLLPYDSREQVTSGVLIEAVAAGKPVVSTGFPHARELLAGGAGLLIDRQDPVAIAAALRRVLTEPGLAAQMSAQARRLAPDLLWSAVAGKYRKIAGRAMAAEITLASA